MRATPWTRGDLLLGGGTVVALAASADTAWSIQARFALDLSGLSALERAGAGLWDLRPLAPAVFAAGCLAILVGLRDPPGRLAALAGPTRSGLVFLAAAHAALALAILALAGWVAAAGEVGGRDELGFVYTRGERAVTLVTQVLAWLPLAALFAAAAWTAAHPGEEAEREPAPEPEEPSERPLFDEMDALWRERLAFGPRRERARTLLGRIRLLEEAGDHEGARELAEEMRRL